MKRCTTFPRGFAIFVASVVATTGIAQPPVSTTYLETPDGQKPRVVITADPELDDNNSLIRYLLFSSDFQTEGLVYASSQYHWRGDGKGTAFSIPGREYKRFGLNLCPCTSYRWPANERYIDDDVEAYAKAYPNLRIHNANYPTPDALKSKIREGNVDFDGEMDHDTPGSDLIKHLLLDDINTPVYLHAWGGESTIARALKSIEEQYQETPAWPAIRAKVIAKAVIHPSGDQDDMYAKYIKPHWPEIRYRELRDGVSLGYDAQDSVSIADSKYYAPAWTAQNISNRGPLGKRYRVWGDGKQMVQGDRFDYFGISGMSKAELEQLGYIVYTPTIHEKGAFLGEGDTDTFLNLIDNGLYGYRDDSLGGWGGVPAKNPTPPSTSKAGPSTKMKVDHKPLATPPRASSNPFVGAAQRDLAARFIWATTSNYHAANHNPTIVLLGSRLLSAKPGQVVMLRAKVNDPDNNRVSVTWRQWSEASSYKRGVALANRHGITTRLKIPRDARSGETIHILATATDDGTPHLNDYVHVVVRVIT